MAEFDFPRRPAGTLQELWQAVIRLLPQLAGQPVMVRNVSVGTSETPIAHGLHGAPLAAVPIRMADVSVWQSKQPDARFVYLQAASATVIDVAVLR